MNPLDIIRKYFRSVISAPDGSSIAAAATIDGISAKFVPLILTLKILSLTDQERQKMGGKDKSDQRARSRAYLRLLAKRPTLATRSGVDPTALQEAIGRDDSLDLLFNTLTQLLQLGQDGLLILSALLSRQAGAVVTYVQTALRVKQLPPDQLRTLKVNFNSVLFTLAQIEERLAKQHSYTAGKQKPAQQTLESVDAQAQSESQISQLRAAAAAQGDLTLPPPSQAALPGRNVVAGKKAKKPAAGGTKGKTAAPGKKTKGKTAPGGATAGKSNA